MLKKKIINVDLFTFNNNEEIEKNTQINNGIRISDKCFDSYLKLISDNLYQNLEIEYLNKTNKTKEYSILNSEHNKEIILNSKYIMPLFLFNKYKDMKWIYWNQYFTYNKNLLISPYSIDAIFKLNKSDIIISEFFASNSEKIIKNNLDSSLNNLRNKLNIKSITSTLLNNKNKNIQKLANEIDDNIQIKILLGSYNKNFSHKFKSLNIDEKLASYSISLFEMETNKND